jgi:predicted ATP-grasp superfamily ATP-dependent carboligase
VTAAIDTAAPAFVLKIDHHCGLGILRSLGRLGVDVYALHADPSAPPAAASRYCKGVFPWDLDEAPREATVEYLLDRANWLGGKPVLLATEDQAALLVDDFRDALAERFLLPEQPLGLPYRLYSKKELFHLCREHGVPTPDTTFPQSRDEFAALVDAGELPVVVKPIEPWELRRSGGSMVIAQTREEALDAYDRLERDGEPNLMLQEYIPGGIETIWMVNAYLGSDSECLVAFSGRKLRQRPAYTGMTSLGECVWNEEVVETTKEFMRRIGYRGVLDMGYRYDARDGLYKVLDVNPRVGATFRLFSAPDGTDVVRAAYLDLTGQPVPPATARDGRRWIVEPFDVVSSVEYIRDGKLSARDWLRSLRGVEETAWFATDDPAPFVRMAAGHAGTLPRRLFSRLA